MPSDSMGDGGRSNRPGGKPPSPGEVPAQHDTPRLPSRSLDGRDPMQPLTDPMRYVRQEREAAAARVATSLKAWRKVSGAASAGAKIPEGGGAPLPGGVRAKMEPALGADLSGVKL